MREVVWAEEALIEYRSAIAYLAPRNPDAAQRLSDTIDATVFGLADMPTGRPGRVVGTYEKLLRGFPYIIAYELYPSPDGEQLVVLGVIHTSRNWTTDRWPETDE